MQPLQDHPGKTYRPFPSPVPSDECAASNRSMLDRGRKPQPPRQKVVHAGSAAEEIWLSRPPAILAPMLWGLVVLATAAERASSPRPVSHCAAGVDHRDVLERFPRLRVGHVM